MASDVCQSHKEKDKIPFQEIGTGSGVLDILCVSTTSVLIQTLSLLLGHSVCTTINGYSTYFFLSGTPCHNCNEIVLSFLSHFVRTIMTHDTYNLTSLSVTLFLVLTHIAAI